MSDVVVTLTRIEIAHLADLITQFADLVDGAPSSQDPAIERLTPDVYPDDAEASRDFRAVTRSDLLRRRAADAQLVRADLPHAAASEDDDPFEEMTITLDPEHLEAWLRVLAALRLVVATRLGIVTEDDDRDPGDARFGIYDWLGFRLETLVQAADEAGL
ncbi:DUF2017 family protein [Microbacterium stercoris]|uniref:DUF2017 family protein n=1 Tax=Microbacterium stercoris TaxID=2820289 RepID=A0A939QJG1_9MICO|nr:DUF2017 family protein [Microbacterium stercoris]MBO3664027.1 DUF2017 family protein [Microbacterium stercoris]